MTGAGGGDGPGGRPVRVLMSVRQPSPRTNPYVIQLVDALRAGADVGWFSWRRGLLGRYDLLHVHWPEVMVRRTGLPARLAARARFALLLLRLGVLRRTAVVRTAHNVAAHESGSRVERFLLGRLDRRTDHWIALNEHTTGLPPGRATVIAHGDYQDWFRRHDVPPPVPGRVVYFGLIRPYKRVDRLLAAFAGLASPGLTLHVAGSPASPELADDVRRAAALDPRVTTHLDYVDDATLAAEVGAAQLVVLPYDDFHNSGALLLALSLGRPVLVPRTAVTSALAEEVGPDWVLTYPGELTPDVLDTALAQVAARPAGSAPDLTRRRWPVVAAEHLACYRQVTARRP